ncbi:Gldg family protein [Allosphingosinicella vermicomposti]|uniref:Gldg family protein n=1 Tax=Allosphingosinicella vermicomposti TaxID=614671 RepID=UPI000D0FA904|nr:hypothetical protein [Allosphingosinicella vermicomposti]
MAWRLALGAAIYALAEIGLGLTLGRVLDWGRAEALLFFAFRPWCLLGLAFAARRQGWIIRLGLYGAGLALASLGEGLLVVGLGAINPMPELARGLLGGLVLVLIYEMLIQGGKRIHRRFGAIAGAVLALPLLIYPQALSFYDGIVLEKEREGGAVRPPLLVMTGLPLLWGGWSDWSREPWPVRSYSVLQTEFDITPLDVLDDAGLAKGRLLLLAQPRRLEPVELVRLDAWVRGGGKALILTDPMLLWPSDLALGDARRPPPIGLLGPLLDHWGLALEEGAERGVAIRISGPRKWTVAAPGRFRAADPGCRLGDEGLLADCRIGRGRALLVADADMLHDTLWAAPGERGGDRHRRIADNPLLVADWLDSLSGLSRMRQSGDVAWRKPGDNAGRAILFALLPVLAAGVTGLVLRVRRKS